MNPILAVLSLLYFSIQPAHAKPMLKLGHGGHLSVEITPTQAGLESSNPAESSFQGIEYNPQPFSEPQLMRAIYGDSPQDLYLTTAENAIFSAEKSWSRFREELSISPSTPPESRFFQILGFLSKQRSKHALATRTPFAERFGIRRDSTYTPFSEQALFLGGQYAKHGQALVHFFSDAIGHHFLSQEERDPSPEEITGVFHLEQEVFGRKNRLTLEILNEAQIEQRGLNVVHFQYGQGKDPADRAIDRIKMVAVTDETNSIYQILLARKPGIVKPGLSQEEAIKSLREKDRQELLRSWKEFKASSQRPGYGYNDIKLAYSISQIRKTFPSHEKERTSESRFVDFEKNKRTHFVIATLRHQVGDKLYGLTQYITWFHYDGSSNLQTSLQYMKYHSLPYMIHQDVFLIEDTLKECEKLTIQVLRWTPELGIAELKNRMAPLMFLLAHNHRDWRGTAAESEWFERSLYRSLGFDLLAPRTRVPDLDALTHPIFSDFVQKYSDSFELVPREITTQTEERKEG